MLPSLTARADLCRALSQEGEYSGISGCLEQLPKHMETSECLFILSSFRVVTLAKAEAWGIFLSCYKSSKVS